MICRIFVTITTLLPLAYTQRPLYGYPREPVTWYPRENGEEDTYMQFSEDWKREIVAWAKDCIFEIKNKIYQLDQINWAAADDVRHQIGVTIGRILELYRQQMDMYRRMKRRFENRFNWIRPELGDKFPQLKVDGAIEPVPGKQPMGDFGYPWDQRRPNHNDYKPHVYLVALEFITKKESEIEHLVKLITNFVGEEEVSRFKPHMLPADQDWDKVWAGYSTYRPRTPAGKVTLRRARGKKDSMEIQEDEYKAKMREEYYKKRNNNKQ